MGLRYNLNLRLKTTGGDEAAGEMNKAGRGAEFAHGKFSGLTGEMSLMKAAAAGLAAVIAGRLVRSFLDASNTTESYRIRLVHMLGSQEQANQLFQEGAAYASRVPFEYRSIMDSATRLSGIVKGGAQQVSAWLPLIGDLAAATGLTFEETTDQMIRVLSAGAGAADMFRERGVLAMVGLQAGVSYSAKASAKAFLDAWTSADSKFRGSTKDLADTWQGLMSMFSDLWFQFRNDVMSQGVFDALKGSARDVLEILRSGVMQDAAEGVGGMLTGIAHGIRELTLALDENTGKLEDNDSAWKRILRDLPEAPAAAVKAMNSFSDLGTVIKFDVAESMDDLARDVELFARRIDELAPGLQAILRMLGLDTDKLHDFAMQVHEAAAGMMAQQAVAWKSYRGKSSMSSMTEEELALQRAITDASDSFVKGAKTGGDYDHMLEGLSDKAGSAKKAIAQVSIETQRLADSQGGIFSGFDFGLGGLTPPNRGTIFDQRPGGGLSNVYQTLDLITSKTGEAVDAMTTAAKTATKDDVQRTVDFRNLSGRALSGMVDQFLRDGRLGWQQLTDEIRGMFGSLVDELIRIMAQNAASGKSGSGLFGGALGKLFGGSAGAVIGGFVAAAGILAAFHANSQAHEKKQYASTAYLHLDRGALQALGTGPNSETAQQIADSMKGILTAVQESTGALIDGLDMVQIKIRRDKKKFEAVGLGIYDTAEEAIAAAMQDAIANGQMGAQLNAQIRQAIAGGAFTTPEGLQNAVQMLQQAHDAFVGLTDTEIQIRNLPAEIEAFNQKLRDTGVSARDAGLATAQYAVASFRSMYDELTGAQQTPQQAAAEAERKRQLFNASRELELAKFHEEEAVLEGQLAVARGEASLDSARLEARRAYLETGHKLDVASLNLDNSYLNAQTQILGQQGRVYTAGVQLSASYTKALAQQLNALKKVIAAMPDAIKPGQIAIPKISSSLSKLAPAATAAKSAVDAATQALQNLAQFRNQLAIGDQTSPYSDTKRLFLARSEIEKLKGPAKGRDTESIQQIQSAVTSYLGIAKNLFATTGGYASAYRYATGVLDEILGANGMASLLDPQQATSSNTAQIVQITEQQVALAQQQLEISKATQQQTAKTTDEITSGNRDTITALGDVSNGMESFTQVQEDTNGVLGDIKLGINDLTRWIKKAV